VKRRSSQRTRPSVRTRKTGIGKRRTTSGRDRSERRASAGTGKPKQGVAAAAVTASELRALRREIDRKMKPLRWNPDTEDVQRSVAQLVLTIVELLRQLMERQAIRRMEEKTLTPAEVDAVGTALMRLEETIRDIGAKFGLTPDDLNLDLGPLGKLM
jgi:Gas vesicle protein K